MASIRKRGENFTITSYMGYASLDENCTFADLTEWILNNYILPHIGKYKLKEITPTLLDNYFVKLQKTGRIRKDKPLSSNTVGKLGNLSTRFFRKLLEKNLMLILKTM